jgi:hypothetical protein
MAIDFTESYPIINWDLNRKGLHFTYFGKKEDSAKGFKVQILQNSVLVIPTTETLRFYCKKEDNTRVYIDATINGSEFIINLTNQVFAIKGTVECELHLDSSGKWLTSDTFYLKVSDNLVDGSIISSDDYIAFRDSLDSLANKITEANTAIGNANTATNSANTAASNANEVATELTTETLIIWKPYVNTYADIATTYVTPELGWATQAKDTGVRWRFNGTAWTNIGVYSDDKIGDLSQLQTTSNTDLVVAINEIYTSNALQVENFGAVGDGIASDSIAFQNAINKALLSNFPAIQLQYGKTYLLKASDVTNYSGVSIFGNGATIKLEGKVRFNLQNLSYFNLTDVFFETNIGLTEDATTQSDYAIFYYTDGTKQVLYNVQRVYVKSTVLQTPKIARYPTFFQSAFIKRSSIFSNMYFENVGLGLGLTNGEYFSLEHIIGQNIETLVYVASGDTVGVFDLDIKNTEAQSLTWIMKNNAVGSNGKSTLLLESGVHDVVLDNIRGEFCIERVVYSQSSNVFANNLYAKDCYGFKFCGTDDAHISKNITIKNLTKIITDDATFDVAKTYSIFDAYYASNINIENVRLLNYRSDKLTSLGSNCFLLLDRLTDITFNDIKAEINTYMPMFYTTVNADATKVLSNIILKNIELTNYGDSSGTSYIFGVNAAVPNEWVNGLTIDNVKVLQDDAQIINKDVSNAVIDVINKKITNIKVTNTNVGFLDVGIPYFQSDSGYVGDNVNEFEFTYKNISPTGSSADNHQSDYYSAWATGIYIPKGKFTREFYPYYIHSNYEDKIITKYQNILSSALLIYSSVESIDFNVLMDTVLTWGLPINVTGKSYLVEVESTAGCGKAIFTGNVVTEIYKTGNCVFTTTASKLQITAMAGSGTDYYINVNNATGTGARVKIKVAKL